MMSPRPPPTHRRTSAPSEGAPGDAPVTSGDRTSCIDWADEDPSVPTTETAIALPVAPPRQATRAVLTVVGGASAGRVHTLRDTETILGRGKEAHVRLDDIGVSRAHARVVRTEDGRWLIEDLRSTNGTFVGGRRIERIDLKSGDRIHVGPGVVLSFAVLDAQAERLTAQLYESSIRDALTRAHNRRYLVERLAGEIAYARRHGTRLSLVLFDIDHFKRINDTHGHLAGDDVLRETAALVQRMIRAEDVLARFGGEEFVVLVRGIEHDNVGRLAERLRAAVERLEVASVDQVLRVTISVGYASLDELPEAQRTGDGLLRRADERLYRAKSGGRNRVFGR
jgi:two-component system cell cycle response regulator